MIHIDQETYKIQEDSFIKKIYPKKQIVIASSLRKNNYHVVRLLNRLTAKKRWNTFTISRDGKIYQHYDPKYYTNFLKIGVKEADMRSISIVLENMGGLFKTSEGEYLNSLNETCDIEFVGKKKFIGQKYWETYPQIQLENLAKLCKILCNEFDIPLRIIEFHHTHEKIMDFNGIVFKSNYINNNNVNPFLNIEKLNELITQ